MNYIKVAACISLIFASYTANSEQLIEKDGRFEFNWSTGKMKFYGTSVGNLPKDGTWRTTEQRAWGEGLAYLEKNLDAVFAKKFGITESKIVEKPNLIKSTASTNTTYFGDSRIKVSLEASINSVISQALEVGGGKVIPKESSSKIEIRLPAAANPSAVLSIVDEKGVELLKAVDVAATIKSGASLNKWFEKSNDSNTIPSSTPILEASIVSKGVLKVRSSEWRPQYASAVANGQASLVLSR